MKRVFVALACILVASFPLSGDEDLQELLDLIQDNAFKINIHARVIENSQVSVWNMEVSRLTISGKTVNVKLTADNIIVIAHITPYIEADEQITLIAQGQVYLSKPGEKNVQYMSTVKSLPVSLGDSVLFYPLGISEKEKKGQFTIELEIQVLPYSS